MKIYFSYLSHKIYRDKQQKYNCVYSTKYTFGQDLLRYIKDKYFLYLSPQILPRTQMYNEICFHCALTNFVVIYNENVFL